MAANDPLLPKELETLEQEATTAATIIPVTVVPSTGLQPAEFLHLHTDWIEWPSSRADAPDNVVIHIPSSEECRRSKIPQGSRQAMRIMDRTEPCESCKQNDKEIFHAPHRETDGYSPILVPDKRAQEILEWWFSQYDTIPWDGRIQKLDRLAKKEIGRRVTLLGLRNTYVAQAASMGFDLDEIKRQIGYQSIPQGRLRRVLREHGDFFDYEQLVISDYLTVLDKKGPITPSQIADHLGRTKSTVMKKLNKLAEEEMVKKTTESTPIEGEQSTWVTTVPPDSSLVCTHDGCEREFTCFVGRGIHQSKTH